jgi:xanthine dehydrogenase accessory factor
MRLLDEVSEKAARLSGEAEPYALALVVRCESPTSAKPGARGLITRDGVITGWIGGGCAQPIVIEESLRAIREGSPRLLRIKPQAGSAEVTGIRTYEMVCFSGGTMDIFIEPVLPPAQVTIFGRSPVARTLARLAKALRYEVVVHSPLATREDFPDVDRLETELSLKDVRGQHSFLVVSTQGEDDEEAVEAAARSDAGYVAFVASKKKWDSVASILRDRGVPKERIARVVAPAGIEIQAIDPEEIALSVMAQIVSTRRSQIPDEAGSPAASASASKRLPVGHATAAADPGSATDPICKMKVDIRSAKHTSRHAGVPYYFCCAGCKQRFDQSPAQYVGH